jgi:hypothetical protein
MEMKNQMVMTFKKGDDVYQFVMPEKANIADIYSVAYEILADMTKRMTDAAEAAKPQDPAPTDVATEVTADVTNA